MFDSRKPNSFSFIENKYNLRNFQEMKQKKIEPIRIGLETTLYRALKLSYLGYKVII